MVLSSFFIRVHGFIHFSSGRELGEFLREFKRMVNVIPLGRTEYRNDAIHLVHGSDIVGAITIQHIGRDDGVLWIPDNVKFEETVEQVEPIPALEGTEVLDTWVKYDKYDREFILGVRSRCYRVMFTLGFVIDGREEVSNTIPEALRLIYKYKPTITNTLIRPM